MQVRFFVRRKQRFQRGQIDDGCSKPAPTQSGVAAPVLQMLATEGPKSVTDLAARTNRLQHSMTKHMQMLRAAGAVVMVAGTDGDRRKLFHALPPGCLRDGANGKEIDYGVCVLRLR